MRCSALYGRLSESMAGTHVVSLFGAFWQSLTTSELFVSDLVNLNSQNKDIVFVRGLKDWSGQIVV